MHMAQPYWSLKFGLLNDTFNFGYSTPLQEKPWFRSFLGPLKLGVLEISWRDFPLKMTNESLRLVTSKRGRKMATWWERDAGVLAEHLGCSSILVAMNLVLCYTCANMFTSFFLQGIWGGPWMWISHDGGYQLQSTIWPLRPSKESKSIKTPRNIEDDWSIRILQWNQDSSVGLWLQWLCLVYLQHLTTIVLGINQLIIMVNSSDYGL